MLLTNSLKVKKMRISLIAAITTNRGLGKGNALLVKIPEDLKRFKILTTGHPIIMGRRTFESIGRVLPNRSNIIISSSPDLKVDGADVVGSLDKALRQAQGKPGSEEVFIIGGGKVFSESISLADRLYLTVIDRELPADVFFPDYSDFKKIISEEKHIDPSGLEYKFLTLER